MVESSADHWQQVYNSRTVEDVSWYQAEPSTSLRLVEGQAGPGAAVVDIGAGASTLVDSLAGHGFADITVVDIAPAALGVVRERLREAAAEVSLVCADVLAWQPERNYDLWHDRAVFHFLTLPGERSRYVELAISTVASGGSLIVATFASDGPAYCSGLPVARYAADGLAAEFSAGFDLVHSEREWHVTPTGAEQPFTWAVLRRR